MARTGKFAVPPTKPAHKSAQIDQTRTKVPQTKSLATPTKKRKQLAIKNTLKTPDVESAATRGENTFNGSQTAENKKFATHRIKYKKIAFNKSQTEIEKKIALGKSQLKQKRQSYEKRPDYVKGNISAPSTTGGKEAYVYFSRWIMDMENGSSLVHVPYPTPTIGFVFSKDVPDYMRHVTPRALTRKQWDDFVGTGGQPKEPVYIDTSGSQQKLSSINIKIGT